MKPRNNWRSSISEIIADLRIVDWAALCFAVFGAVVFSWLVYATSATDGPPIVNIRTADGQYKYPLTQERTLTFPGPIGKTVVQIANNSVQVASDPGPKQICVKQGWIDTAGQWLACLPNHVFVKISGKLPDSPVDAKTY